MDSRSRLSKIWIPTGPAKATEKGEDSHSLLMRAGFLRQAHSGFFHLLPLGLRVQEKLETLIDKHMGRLGASKLALSTVSSTALWQKSGRLEGGSELFRVQDRRKSDYLLSPTHEEEITSLVAGICQSYKELPLKLYQITRKYRDEARPRHGLLRTREFLMKDLYTFDHSVEDALSTYKEVRQAYLAFFDELKIPYLVAEADSGNMGGSVSHEYHVPTSMGEDCVISCDACEYVANEELAESSVDEDWFSGDVGVWTGTTADRSILVQAFYPTMGPGKSGINIHAVRRVIPSLDASLEDPIKAWEEGCRRGGRTGEIMKIYDCRIPLTYNGPGPLITSDYSVAQAASQAPRVMTVRANPTTTTALNLLKIGPGNNRCPRCTSGHLHAQRAIELGHTFLLGTRYSEVFDASVASPLPMTPSADVTGPTTPTAPNITSARTTGTSAPQATQHTTPLQMGCHGIGISRMIGAIAEVTRDSKGLNWPRVMAPWEVVIVLASPTTKTDDDEEVAEGGMAYSPEAIYDIIYSPSPSSTTITTTSTTARSATTAADKPAQNPIERETEPDLPATTTTTTIIDDRPGRSLIWKLKDADLIGIPVVVILGRSWVSSGGRQVEVQCRALSYTAPCVDVERELRAVVDGLVGRL